MTAFRSSGYGHSSASPPLRTFRRGAPVSVSHRKADERRLHLQAFLKEQLHTHFGNLRHRLHDGGADVILHAQLPDAVEADDLHVLGHPLAQPAQYLYDKVGEAVSHAEDAVKGQFPVLYVRRQKFLKRFIRIYE